MFSNENTAITVCSTDSLDHACGYLRLSFPLCRLFPHSTLRHLFPLDSASVQRGEIIATDHIDLSLPARSNMIIMQRLFPQFSTIETLESILAAECPVVYDIDDLLTEMPAWHCHRQFVEDKRPVINETMRHVDAVTVSTEALREQYSRVRGNVFHLPNLIDEKLWYARRQVSKGPVCIGVGGTPTHVADLTVLEKPLEKIAHEFGKQVRFVFLGCVTERLMNLPNCSFIPFTSSYREYVNVMHDAHIDIALVPLRGNRFNRCKSNIKWLEYTLCGAAGVYSDVRPYQECIRHGETGLLVSGVAQWHAAVRRLVMNRAERNAIVESSREDVLQGYTWKAAGWRYQEFYSAIDRLPVKSRSRISRKRLASGMVVSGKRLKSYPDDAMRCFQRAAMLNPENAQSYCEAADIYLNHDVWEQAEPLLEKAIEIRPRYGRAYRLLATVLERSGRTEEAGACNDLADAMETGGAWG